MKIRWTLCKNTEISPNFMVRKFCRNAQFPHSFGQMTRNYAKTMPFQKISTPRIYVKIRHLTQCVFHRKTSQKNLGKIPRKYLRGCVRRRYNYIFIIYIFIDIFLYNFSQPFLGILIGDASTLSQLLNAPLLLQIAEEITVPLICEEYYARSQPRLKEKTKKYETLQTHMKS